MWEWAYVLNIVLVMESPLASFVVVGREKASGFFLSILLFVDPPLLLL
jgi:hypothetical protein